MPHVSRTTRARRDLLDIWLYIAQDNLSAADEFLETIGHKCADVAAYPQSGRSREELAANLRNIPVGNYIVFYRPIHDGVEIMRVLSAARDVDRFF